MRDHGIKFTLAVFSFLLGLVATFATTAYFEKRKTVAYSVFENRLVVVREVGAKVEKRNETEFSINIENIGDLRVKDFSVLIEANKDAKISKLNMLTKPRREVPVGSPAVTHKEFRVPNITLDPSQALIANFVVSSEEKPRVELYFSSERGEVKWKRVSPALNLTLQDSLFQLIWLSVLAVILPGLLIVVPRGIALFFFGSGSNGEKSSAALWPVARVSEVVSKLVLFGVLLLMISPAKAVIEQGIQLIQDGPSPSLELATEGVSSPIVSDVKGDVIITIEAKPSSPPSQDQGSIQDTKKSTSPPE